MILEEETYRKFGYYPGDLSFGSSKRILAKCDKCGKIREVDNKQYRELCHSCANSKSLKRHYKLYPSKLKGKNHPNWKGGGEKRKCKYCDREFVAGRSDIKKGYGIFCSRVCMGKWESENIRGKNHPAWIDRVEQTCPICGKVFRIPTYRLKRGGGNFCSQSCARKAKKIPNHHTIPERVFENISKKHGLPFHYVGDGQLWIGKKGTKQLNPDFIEANGKKICVEIMGRYWHSPLLNQNLRKDALLSYRKRHYQKYKWKSVFLWDTDLLRDDAEFFVLATFKKEGILPVKGK